MHLPLVIVALAASFAASREPSSRLSDLAIPTPLVAAGAARRDYAPARNNVSVTASYQTTLTTVARRPVGSVLSSAHFHGAGAATVVRLPASTTYTDPRLNWTTPTPTPKPAPYRCETDDCWNHPDDKDRRWCEAQNAERCSKEWESMRSKVWEISTVVNDGQGPNARKTLITMDSSQFKEWQKSLVTSFGWASPEPTVDAYDGPSIGH